MASKKYQLKSDGQKETLKRFFDAGMTGKGAEHTIKISEAMKETGLSEVAVKNWIGDERKRRKNQNLEADAQPSKTVKLSYVRGPTSYNNFCSEFSKSEQCKNLSIPERNTLVAQEWAKLSTNDKAQYKSKPSFQHGSMSEADQKKMVQKCRKQLINLVAVLEEYNCSVVIMNIEPDGKLYGLGSADGQEFLSCNPDVMYKFTNQISGGNQNVTYKDVTKLFNQKYSEMLGRTSRVPYLKGGFEVEGLPEGLPFKKPFMYGTRQMRKIMGAKDDIKFHPTPPSESLIAPTTNPYNQIRPAETERYIGNALKVIAGEEVAARALQPGGEVISEEEVEVINLSLNQTELWAVQSEGPKYFHQDAWLALHKNIAHKQSESGVVLPVLSDTGDERFWLFYTTLKLGKVLSAGIHKALPGYWLNLDDEGASYNILHDNLTDISKINVIKIEDGSPLYHQCTLNVKSDKYCLNEYFRYAILMVLDRTINMTLES